VTNFTSLGRPRCPILGCVVKENTAGRDAARKNLLRTTRAFEHGENAYGARYIKPGFAREAGDDLLFALGWPHVHYIVDGHPDDLITDPKDLEKVVFRQQFDLDVPRDIAVRRIRSLGAFSKGPDGQQRPGALRAMQDREPIGEADAAAFVRDRIAARSLGSRQLEVALMLEAFAGPDAIAEAVTTAFEKATDAQLLEHAPEKSVWAFVLGFLLLRARAEVSIALRERLEAILVRCPKDNVNSHSVANVLDQVLRQSKARLRTDHTDQSMLLHYVDESAPLVVRELGARSWCGAAYPRMVFLGGDEVISYYTKHFEKVAEKAAQKVMVAQFGRIASPAIRELMEEMSNRSKAETEARDWLNDASNRHRR
jgi:hypothetical protein